MWRQDNHFFNPSFTTLYNTNAALILLLVLLFSFSSNKQIPLREGVGKMAKIQSAKDNFEVLHSELSLLNSIILFLVENQELSNMKYFNYLLG